VQRLLATAPGESIFTTGGFRKGKSEQTLPHWDEVAIPAQDRPTWKFTKVNLSLSADLSDKRAAMRTGVRRSEIKQFLAYVRAFCGKVMLVRRDDSEGNIGVSVRGSYPNPDPYSHSNYRPGSDG
jgi:hypothetical protein